MASVWFIGYADVRIISSADWTTVGAPGITTTWDKTNGWSISQSVLTADQISYLDDHDEFVVTNSNGPRPGSVVTPEVDATVSREDLLELKLVDLDDVDATSPSVGRVLGVVDVDPLLFDILDPTSMGFALDTGVVHKLTDETISGTKTFSNAPIVPSGAFPQSTISGLAADLAEKVDKDNNLSDLNSASAARTNLGLNAIAASGSAADLSSGTVPPARLGSGTANSTTFLRGDNTWQTVSAGGGSGIPASAQIIFALDPPSGSGLSAITANGSTNDSTALQAMIDYVTTTWGEGKIMLPGASIKCNSGLTGLGRVQLVGQGKDLTVLDFSGAGTSVLAIDSTNENTCPITHLKLVGPNTGDKLTYPTNASTGVRLAGTPARLEHVRIHNFFYGVDSTNNNSFFHTLFDVHIGYAGVGWDLNGSTAHNGGSTPSEFGEKMVFIDGSIFNSQLGVDIDQSGVGFWAFGSSFDYLGRHGKIINGSARFVGCHLETGYAAIGSGTQGNWGSVNRYLFDLQYEPRVSFDACRFEIRDPGVYGVIDHANGPAAYNSGYVAFGPTNHWYGQMPDGSQRIFCSKEKVSWPSGDGSTKTIPSPFLSKWNGISARPIMNDGTFIPAGHSARVTGNNYGTGSTGQAITLTRDLASGVTAADMWLEIVF